MSPLHQQRHNRDHDNRRRSHDLAAVHRAALPVRREGWNEPEADGWPGTQASGAHPGAPRPPLATPRAVHRWSWDETQPDPAKRWRQGDRLRPGDPRPTPETTAKAGYRDLRPAARKS